jgi:hypothetical protein
MAYNKITACFISQGPKGANGLPGPDGDQVFLSLNSKRIYM